MPVQMETGEKVADRFRPDTALESEQIERGHHQALEPSSAVIGFPKPRLGFDTAAIDGLPQAMHIALGKSGLLGNPLNTLTTVIPNKLENSNTFVPKSHISQLSEGVLNSAMNSILQSTWLISRCPALRGYSVNGQQ